MQRNKSAQIRSKPPQPQQLQGNQLSKETFDKYINNKFQKTTPKSQKDISFKNNKNNLPNIENHSHHNNSKTQYNNEYYSQQKQYPQQNGQINQHQQNQKNQPKQPFFSQTTKNSKQRNFQGVPKSAKNNDNNLNNNNNFNNNKSQRLSAHSQSGYIRPQSSSYNKPLIVHVEKQLQEEEFLKNPSVNKLKGWDKEDFEKEQENKLSDKLWDEVYYTKNKINELQQQNNDTRAKIWNIEKENRKMQKQIEQWGLQQGVIFDKDDNAFVDSMTVQKVYKDENFYAVTMKQQLKDLSKELQEKQDLVKDYKHRINNFQQEIETVNETLKDAQKSVIINAQKLKEEQKKLKKNEETLEKIKKGIYEEEEEDLDENGEKYYQDDNYDNHIEDLRFESEDLAAQISELQEKNKVILFEIQIQKKANENSESEKVQLKKKLDKKLKEIQILRQELNQRGINQEYNEFEIKKKREPKKKEKTEDEIIEEKERKIEDLKGKISVLNFDIQKMTQAKIIDKQDNQKEIEQSQREIYELEEKYLNLVTEYYRVKARNMDDAQYNKSNITYFGSEGDKDSSISEVDSIDSNIIYLNDEQ
ncbi:hypothetical protein PPERSA_06173 [Pseudocohnilembus persalinus]|uniref:Uncharacterized protein n=1 Tax=Pseudocohnilembus persalinus TaxID=266149 RepID=A0A0V0R0P3_PSEPJ|nr:hypothetical protein PPERSA_06173 [Pseudocohnilembus persalinus]|eukprot:KRX07995.1 hypothetical protein PPERSA_06173 [Pseudocohnilembus persalinus]